MASPKHITIDPTGNLLVILENPNWPVPFHFRVSSKVLSLSSPFFASLFPSPAAHADQYQIILRNDTPETLGTLLELCHFRRTLPLPYAQLQGFYGLAVVSQKYEIVAPLIPWITLWAEPLHATGKLNFSDGNDLEKWLTVACVYNQGLLFRKITKQAVLTGSAESLDTSRRWNPPYNSIVEKISSERINALSKLTASALTLLSRYQTTESVCKQPTNSKECDIILLGSVIKGLMGISVYHPIPDAPYLGMTVVDLERKIRELPLMWYPAHNDVCGARISGELKTIVKSMQEILDEAKGLDLGNFQVRKGAGRPENLVLTALKNGIQQQQRQQEREQKREDRHRSDDKDEAKVKVEGKSEILANTVVVDTESGYESVTSVMAKVSASLMDSFRETGEAIDLRSQESFNARDLSQTARTNLGNGEKEKKLATENPFTDEKSRENEIEEITSNPPFMEEEKEEKNDRALTVKKPFVQERGTEAVEPETSSVDEQASNPDAMEPVVLDKQKEQLRPTAKDFVPSFPLESYPPKRNPFYTPRSRKELTTALKPAPVQHTSAKANAEAKGQSWETPGPELVQKYQRGPRFPFHPEVTVRDVSDINRKIEINNLKDIFPQLDIKIIVEFLRQNNWNSQDAALVLNSGGIPMDSVGGGSGAPTTPSFPVLKPTVLFPPKPTTSSPQGSSEGIVNTARKSSSGSSTVSTVVCQDPVNVPKKPSRTLSSYDTISVSRLITGASGSDVADSDSRFWPEADNEVVMRALGLQENKLAIKQLLAIFPRARADKGLIDVLYRSGWDTEKAARKLEEYGFERNESGSSGRDGGGNLKPKGNGRIGVKVKGEGGK